MYRKLDNSFTIKSKSMPAVGDFVQYTAEKAFLVKRVYHILKEINQVSNGSKADAIIFVVFVSDLSVSNF